MANVFVVNVTEPDKVIIDQIQFNKWSKICLIDFIKKKAVLFPRQNSILISENSEVWEKFEREKFASQNEVFSSPE